MRKSQAALEFLTTYSWAFLVIIIMVGALAYFGVLSPSKLLPDRCNFGSEIGCNKDFMVVNNLNDNALTLRLENDFGGPVVIVGGATGTTVTTDIAAAGTCTPQVGNTIATLANIPVVAPLFTWNSDSTIIFAADCATGTALIEKEKVKFTIELVYYSAAAGSAYTKRVFGEVFTGVQ